MIKDRKPRVLYDIPMGKEGTRGRLIIVEPVDDNGVLAHRVLFYHGTNKKSKVRIAGAPLGDLRSLHDSMETVERRVGRASDLGYAIAEALDLPAADDDVVTIIHYLESVA